MGRGRIWRRCARGEHAYPPRTRELRPGRPMVLCLGMGEQVAAGNHFESGDVAQLGEHLPCKQGVKGSNPSISMMGL